MFSDAVVSEIMQLQRQSFQDAVAQYNQQFSQALQLYNLIDKEDDELYSFVLEGATSNKYIYECIYSSKDVETLP